MKKLLVVVSLILTYATSYGAGFGIYESSARGSAMGGAIVGDVYDASANYHNPANIANATNVQLSLGFTLINPYCDVEVNNKPQRRMNPGWFIVPTFYLTTPITDDLSFGWGNYTEFGLGTKYAHNWDLANDTVQTTLEQFTMNPNLAYKITDKWNVSAGARISYINVDIRNQPYYGNPYANLHSKLAGDDLSLGWNLATSYKVTDDISMGLIYRSKIKHKLHGTAKTHGMAPYVHPMYGPMSVPYNERKSITGKIDLPESLSYGINWDATDRFRMGSVITYTRWSSVKTIDFKDSGGTFKSVPLHWHDTIRVGFGFEYDFTDWFTGRLGYAFDRDPTSTSYQSSMLPAGDRHIISWGAGFKLTENLTLDFSYGFIRMNNEHYPVNVHNADGSISDSKRMSTRNGFSHLIGMNLSYSF